MKRLLGALLALCLASSVQAQTLYPTGYTPVTISAQGTTAAVVATMPASTSGANYLCGFSVRSLATAATNGPLTITGVYGGTVTFQQFIAPLASGIGITERDFNPCLASNHNTALVLTTFGAGAGGVTSVVMWGFKR